LKLESYPNRLLLIENVKVPLKGLIQILAAALLIADTDVLGSACENAGYVIERGIQGKPIAARAVKIDSGFAFNFRGLENQFYQSMIPHSNNRLKQDRRHLQYGNMAKPILWSNLTNSQQKEFTLSLNNGLTALRNSKMVTKMINRKEFLQTPKFRALPPLNINLDELEENLNWQEETFKFDFSL